MTEQAPPLRLEHVTHSYGAVTALSDVSLGIEDGELVTLLGPSGCGKTTLLRIIAGFIRPTSGRVIVGGRDVTRVPPHKRAVNLVFQRPTLFPHLSVFENVAFGLRIARVAKQETRARVEEALSSFAFRASGRGEATNCQADRCSELRSRGPSSTGLKCSFSTSRWRHSI